MSIRILFRLLYSNPLEFSESKSLKEESFQDWLETNFSCRKDSTGIEDGFEKKQLDTHLSVYYADPSEMVRIVTEHHASFDSGPQLRHALIIRERPPKGKLIKSDGETKFGLPNNTHFELQFDHENFVKDFVKSQLDSLKNITFSIPALLQTRQAASLVKKGDPEWIRLWEEHQLPTSLIKGINRTFEIPALTDSIDK